MRIIKRYDEASSWKKISKDDLLNLLQRQLGRVKQEAESGNNYEGYLFANGGTKNWETYIHFTPWYVSFSNGETRTLLDAKKDIFIDSKNSNSDFMYFKGTDKDKSNYTPSVAIFCRGGIINGMVIDIFKAKDLPNGLFFTGEYNLVYSKEGLKIDFWDSSDLFILFGSRKGEMIKIYPNKKSKDYYADVNNKYDMVFKDTNEIVEYLNKGNYYFVGYDRD